MAEKRKKILVSVFGLMLITVMGIVSYYVYQGIYYVKTEDAKVNGDIVRVIPQVVGELEKFDIKEGDYVNKDEILAKQSIDNISGSDFEKALIKAPIAGKIIKKQGVIGENVAPGQVLMMIVDPEKLYITANIEETKLEKVKIGQVVDIKIDQFKNKKFTGKIKAIGNAANSAFSMFPSSTGTTFTKVVQKSRLISNLIMMTAFCWEPMQW